MNVSELHKEYQTGKLNKKDYSTKAFIEYEGLLAYPELLSCSDICEISITRDEVLFRISLKSYNGQEYSVLMRLWDRDAAQIPAAILSFEHYEKDELEMTSRILSFLPIGCVVLDVGANLGWYSLNIKKQRPDANVYAFEPVQETFNKMRYHFNLNSVLVNSFNIGLYNELTDMVFYYDTVASGASSMRDLREVDTTVCEKCHMETLDYVFKKCDIPGLDFIKCDVEGSELFVYQGGTNCIEKYRPVVFSEMLRKWSAKFGYHPNDIISFFNDRGYNCYVMNNKMRLRELKKVTDETIETNYFFLNIDKHKEIIKALAI